MKFMEILCRLFIPIKATSINVFSNFFQYLENPFEMLVTLIWRWRDGVMAQSNFLMARWSNPFPFVLFRMLKVEGQLPKPTSSEKQDMLSIQCVSILQTIQNNVILEDIYWQVFNLDTNDWAVTGLILIKIDIRSHQFCKRINFIKCCKAFSYP